MIFVFVVVGKNFLALQHFFRLGLIEFFVQSPLRLLNLKQGGLDLDHFDFFLDGVDDALSGLDIHRGTGLQFEFGGVFYLNTTFILLVLL